MTKKASEYLNECLEVQKQRGEQYDSKGTGERSFAACATAYNAITGGNLKGSDVCLILQVLKDVRQYSDPSRLHEDSCLDKVSYSSLHAEELNRELKVNKFNSFKLLMNSRIKKYSDDVLLLMWNDWHCEHDIFKVPYRELGISRNDRNNLVKVMGVLGIEEVIALTGVNHRVYPAYFNEENKAMFATMQHQIATKREYRVYDTSTPNN